MSSQEYRMQTSRVLSTLAAALVISVLCSADPASAEQRSGVGPCRQGVLALIGMLDDGDLKSADYRHAFTAVVGTCGPVARSKLAPKPAGAAQCRTLAGRMLDEIEEGRLNGKAFVEVRDTFAQGCGPG
jgi:hypothetical protein